MSRIFPGIFEFQIIYLGLPKYSQTCQSMCPEFFFFFPEKVVTGPPITQVLQYHISGSFIMFFRVYLGSEQICSVNQRAKEHHACHSLYLMTTRNSDNERGKQQHSL